MFGYDGKHWLRDASGASAARESRNSRTTMKIECHLHTSRYSPCAINTPEEMLRALVGRGYEAVFITEHDTVWSDAELGELWDAFPWIRIFPGVELSLGTHHLLVLGTNDPKYLELGDPADVVKKARDGGHLTVLAHPYRYEGAARMLDDGVLPDAMEYCTPNHDPYMADRSLNTACRLNLRLLNTGDVHSRDRVGHYWIETHRPVEQGEDLRRLVLESAYDLRVNEDDHINE